MAGERNKIGVRRSPNGVLRSDENRTGKLKYILIQQIHSAIILEKFSINGIFLV